MSQIIGYLSFSGNCAEAMNFYKECIGGELEIMTVRDSPIANTLPAEMGNSVMHSQLANKGITIMSSDMMREKRIQGNNISLMLSCDSENEIRTYFEKLSNGGKIVDALTEQFWGATFGVLIDKFGIQWMLNFDKSKK